MDKEQEDAGNYIIRGVIMYTLHGISSQMIKCCGTRKTHGRDKKYFYFGYKTSQEVTGITGFYANRMWRLRYDLSVSEQGPVNKKYLNIKR